MKPAARDAQLEEMMGDAPGATAAAISPYAMGLP
jgi:hypothetical protein